MNITTWYHLKENWVPAPINTFKEWQLTQGAKSCGLKRTYFSHNTATNKTQVDKFAVTFISIESVYYMMRKSNESGEDKL